MTPTTAAVRSRRQQGQHKITLRACVNSWAVDVNGAKFYKVGRPGCHLISGGNGELKWHVKSPLAMILLCYCSNNA